MAEEKHTSNLPEVDIDKKIGNSIAHTISAIIEERTIRKTIRSIFFKEGLVMGIILAMMFSGIMITYNSIKSALSLGWVHDLLLGITLISIGLVCIYKVQR